MSSRENFTGQRSRGGAFPAEGRTRTKAWKQEQASCGQAPESLPARMASRYGAQRERAEPGGVGTIVRYFFDDEGSGESQVWIKDALGW